MEIQKNIFDSNLQEKMDKQEEEENLWEVFYKAIINVETQ